MGRWCAILLVLGSGCAQLFGIQNTSGGADAAPGTVSMQIQRITVGPTVMRTAEDVSGLVANFLVPDTTDPSGFRRVAGVVDPGATDTWTAVIPDGNPPMEITLGADYPDTFRRLYAFPQRHMKVLYGIYEDTGAVDPPAGGMLAVTLNLPTARQATEAFQLYSLGAWANHGFTTAELGTSTTKITATIPYNSTTWGSTSGRPIKKITSSDLVLGLRYVSSYQLTGAAEYNTFDQSGGTDAISATMTANTLAPLDVHIQTPASIAGRLAQPTPAGATLAMAWSVNAAPGWEIANGTGPLLHHADVLMTDPGTVTLPFGNPFASKDWRSLFTFSSNKSRTYMVPGVGNLPATLYTGINQAALVGPGLVIDAAAPVPVLVSINQTPLGTDGKTIALDMTKSVELALVADTPTALFYQWNVYELRPNAGNTAAEAHVVYVALATEPKVTLPNDVFVAGKTYQVRAHCIVGGYPSFADGNLWDRSLPYSVGYLDAGIFSVTAQ